jgi:hypothetical protein
MELMEAKQIIFEVIREFEGKRNGGWHLK